MQDIWALHLCERKAEPMQRHLDFVQHIYRESNTEADTAAGRHSFGLRVCGTASNRNLWRVQFDGSFIKETQAACAGWVIWGSDYESQRWEIVLQASVPLTATSAVQSELGAAALVTASVCFLILFGVCNMYSDGNGN